MTLISMYKTAMGRPALRRPVAVCCGAAAAASMAGNQPAARAYHPGPGAPPADFSPAAGRYLAGFSFPAPRRLDQIVKYALIAREPADEIRRIWAEAHAEREDAVGMVLDEVRYNALRAQAAKYPFFVFPVFRGEGGKFFMLLAQWQDDHCIFTYLEDYKRDPTSAQPYMAIKMHTDFLQSKDVVLVRGDFSGYLNKADAKHLVTMLMHIYLRDSKWLVKFNKDPSAFNFQQYLEQYPKGPPSKK